MKSVLILVMFFSILNIAFAEDKEGRTISVSKSKEIRVDEGRQIFTLYYTTSETSPLFVTIMNKAGKVVFKEKITNTKSFSRPYNFHDLPSGTYKFLLKDDQETVSTEIDYLSPADINGLVKMSFLTEENRKLSLKVVNNQGQSVKFTIYNADERIIYTETVMAVNFKRPYDLSKVYEKGITIVATCNGQSIYKRY